MRYLFFILSVALFLPELARLFNTRQEVRRMV